MKSQARNPPSRIELRFESVRDIASSAIPCPDVATRPGPPLWNEVHRSLLAGIGVPRPDDDDVLRGRCSFGCDPDHSLVARRVSAHRHVSVPYNCSDRDSQDSHRLTRRRGPIRM